MQLIVAGMHRSGTSAVARILNLMGASAGPPGDLGQPATDNPKGFWERRDARELNDRILAAAGCSWKTADRFSLETILPADSEALSAQVGTMVFSMEPFRPWFLKDPRLCVTLPLWRRHLECPLYVVPIRHPMEVAHSLSARDGLPIERGLALWEHYNASILEHVGDAPAVFVSYARLAADPLAQTQRLWELLVGAGVDVLRFPDDREILAFLSPSLRHHDVGVNTLLSESQRRVLEQLLEREKRGLECKSPSHKTHARAERNLLELVWVLREELRDKDEQIEQLRGELAGAESRNTLLAAALNESSGDRRNAGEEHLRRLLQWADELTRLAEASFDSARWRIGHAICRAAEVLLLRGRPMLARDRIFQIGTELSHWKSRQALGRGDGSGSLVPVLRAAGVLKEAKGELVRQRQPGPPGPQMDVIVFPVIDWEFRIQRPQHLARELAALGHRVFYLSTVPCTGELQPGFEIFASPHSNVFLCRLQVRCRDFPNLYRDRLRGANLEEARQALDAMCDELGIVSAVAIVDLPFWRPLAESLSGALTVYDCMDHHAGFSTNTSAVLREEQRLVESADLVVTTSEWLQQRIANRRLGPTTLIRNGAEVERFRVISGSDETDRPRPVIGYVGAISEWFDVELLCAVATICNEYDFILYGAVTQVDVSALRALSNVQFCGEIPYDEVAAAIEHFDVCLIPFQLNELTLATNPVKVYEYLACGKPVVATNLPEVLALPEGLVHCAGSAGEFSGRLRTAFAERSDAQLRARRHAFAAKNGWPHRAKDLDNAIQQLLPSVSVVVLCWNNLEFTRACLSSVEAYSGYPRMEVIVVDNGSSDGTVEFLRDFASSRGWIRLIENGANLGFAKGNNVGMEAATGDFVILLNNDTYVTPGWISDLLRHFRRAPDLGALGPVTNNIGNEARIDIAYTNMAEMAEQARAWTRRHAGKRLDCDVVAFFCVVFPREVLAKVGLLDEDFGQGFFEDDDYCRRIKAAGFQVAIAEDVFIHHHLSASFATLATGERDALFERNKAIYERKWGKWKAHQYR